MRSSEKCPLSREVLDRGEGVALVRIKCELAPGETLSRAFRRNRSVQATGSAHTAAITFRTKCQAVEDSCSIAEVCRGKKSTGWYHDKK